MAALRELSPIRKVPVAIADGLTLFDSRVIIDWITAHHGFGGLAGLREPWREANLVNAIDSAIDAVIQLFYLRRDGVAIDGTPYATRQLERADAIFTWLGTQLAPDRRGFAEGLGLPEITIVCALDWMDFRKAYPTERAAAVESVRAAWAEHPSLAATRPQV
jgi:glutathione S-transferase